MNPNNSAAEKIQHEHSSGIRATFAEGSAAVDQLFAARAQRSRRAARSFKQDLTQLKLIAQIEIGTAGRVAIWLPRCVEKFGQLACMPLVQAPGDSGVDIFCGGQWSIRGAVDRAFA